jgi:hypothetical protein
MKPAARGAEQAAAIPAPRKRLGGPADHLRDQQEFESHSYRFWSNIPEYVDGAAFPKENAARVASAMRSIVNFDRAA